MSTFQSSTPMPISYWLSQLPKEYAELAKHCYKTHGLGYRVISLHDAILHMDTWVGTDEGEQFWMQVCGYRHGKCALPPIPNSTPKTLETIMPDRLIGDDVVEMFIETPKPPTRIQEMVESKTPESLAQIIVDQEKLIHSLQDRIKYADNALGRASKFAKKLKTKVKHLKQAHRDKGDGISICLTEIQSILNKANQINQ